MNDIQIRIKELRKQHKLTQKEMANLLKVTQQAYQQIEAGIKEDMRISTLKKICNIFNVSSDYILGLENDTAKSEQTKRGVPLFGNTPVLLFPAACDRRVGQWLGHWFTRSYYVRPSADGGLNTAVKKSTALPTIVPYVDKAIDILTTLPRILTPCHRMADCTRSYVGAGARYLQRYIYLFFRREVGQVTCACSPLTQQNTFFYCVGAFGMYFSGSAGSGLHSHESKYL